MSTDMNFDFEKSAPHLSLPRNEKGAEEIFQETHAQRQAMNFFSARNKKSDALPNSRVFCFQ
jgi:hypothetical protein